jgi:hypothetical protein
MLILRLPLLLLSVVCLAASAGDDGSAIYKLKISMRNRDTPAVGYLLISPSTFANGIMQRSVAIKIWADARYLDESRRIQVPGWLPEKPIASRVIFRIGKTTTIEGILDEKGGVFEGNLIRKIPYTSVEVSGDVVARIQKNDTDIEIPPN